MELTVEQIIQRGFKQQSGYTKAYNDCRKTGGAFGDSWNYDYRLKDNGNEIIMEERITDIVRHYYGTDTSVWQSFKAVKRWPKSGKHAVGINNIPNSGTMSIKFSDGSIAIFNHNMVFNEILSADGKKKTIVMPEPEKAPNQPAATPQPVTQQVQTPKPEPAPAPVQAPQPKPTPKPEPVPEPKSPASNIGVDPTAKFAFNGTPYNIKGRLCHDIVKFYVEQHPNVKLEQLKQIFNVPKCDVIVEMLDKAMLLFNSAGKAGGCHYIKKEDQIKINEGMVVVWDYWPERYYPDFMNNVKKLGYEVETRENVKGEEPVETPKKTPSVEELLALDKLIDAALEDFVLTEDERKILMNKVDTIGMDYQEFALILNAKIDKRMKEKPAEETTEKKKGFFARLFGM